ncbi:DUF2079 domain-containing protein, partial [Patescibacteria group bacterium]|nr:DUF2079 domain-containing protein [Patescibacteria group bacterium]
YHDIDLAYFAQTIWNTAHGHLFQFTIHPTLSLGDHAEWILLPLAAIYRVAPHPLTLLFLQTIALAAAAFPLYRIAQRKLPAAWALGVSLSYFALAIPANAALFEFHALIFALPFLLFAADAYERNAYKPFLFWIILSLAVREDVALVVLAFFPIALLDRRNWRWVIPPALLALAVCALDILTIRTFAVAGAYKFSVYYAWLGNSPSAALGTLLSSPFTILGHFFSVTVWEFLLGLIMPVLFLPFLRPRYLLLAALPILGIILQSSGGGVLALQMHYATLVLPGLLLASIDGLQAVLTSKTRFFPWGPLQGNDQRVFGLILGVAIAAQAWWIGPLPGILRLPFTKTDPGIIAGREIVAKIPPSASVAASDAFLPILANRPYLYSLKYIGLGKTQYAVANYTLPEQPEYLLMDAQDALVAAIQYPSLGWTRDLAPTIPTRLRALLTDGRYGAIAQQDRYTLWQLGTGTGSVSPVVGGGTVTGGAQQIGNAKVYGIEKMKECVADELCLAMTLSLDTDPKEDLALGLTIKDVSGKILAQETRIIGDQLFPTHEWKPGEIHTLHIHMRGADVQRATTASVAFFRPRGILTMGPLRSSVLGVLRDGTAGTDVVIR